VNDLLEVAFLKMMGFNPIRVNDDGTEEEIEFESLSPEELRRIYDGTIDEIGQPEEVIK